MPRRRSLLVGAGTALSAWTVGCTEPGSEPGSGSASESNESSGATRSGTSATAEGTLPPADPDPAAQYGYTHLQATGNRVLEGAGDVAGVDPVAVELDGRPVWLVALAADGGSCWTVVTADGRARTVRIRDGDVESLGTHAPLPEGMPPLARRTPAGVGLVRPPGDVAGLTHPVVTGTGLLYVAADGDLVLGGTDGTRRFDVGALPDGRIVRVDAGRYALLGDQTTRYNHGALGDQREGGSLVIFDATRPGIETRARLDPPAVFEGIGPLVADVDGDGDSEIVLTVADASDGARIAVFDPDGSRLATGPVYGPGWRHQLAVAPFGPGDRPELAVVRKPHVDRVLEFYRLSDGRLDVVTTLSGVSSHTYGSHNLDGALAGDIDGDGRVELLVPTRARDELLAVRRTDGGAAVAWRQSLPGPVGTNLAGVALGDGRVAVGVGTGTQLRLWQG